MQHGGADFDSSCGIPSVSRLLEGLPPDALLAHAKLLCALLGSSKTESEQGTAAENEIEADGDISIAATSTVDSLLSLAKNAKLAGRGDICAGAVAVLIRISCFGKDSKPTSHPTVEGVQKKTSKKRKGGIDESTTPSALVGLPAGLIDCMVEFVNAAEKAAPFPEGLVKTATQRLLVLLADLGTISIAQLNCPAPIVTPVPVVREKDKDDIAKREREKRDGAAATVMDAAIASLSIMQQSGLLLSRVGAVSAADLGTLLALREIVRDASLGQEKEEEKKEEVQVLQRLRLGEALHVLMAHTLFQTLTFDEVGVGIHPPMHPIHSFFDWLTACSYSV